MSAYKKLMEARIALQAEPLKKSGHNKFAGYSYFELGDFLPTTQKIFHGLGLCGVVSYNEDIATLTIHDVDGGDPIVISSPMGSAALKGTHEVQQIGAVETYQRRYLWITAMEIVEHDALDAETGKEPKPQPKQAATVSAVEMTLAMESMRKADNMTNLQSIFGGVWKRADEQQKKPLKALYEELKHTLAKESA